MPAEVKITFSFFGFLTMANDSEQLIARNFSFIIIGYVQTLYFAFVITVGFKFRFEMAQSGFDRFTGSGAAYHIKSGLIIQFWYLFKYRQKKTL